MTWVRWTDKSPSWDQEIEWRRNGGEIHRCSRSYLGSAFNISDVWWREVPVEIPIEIKPEPKKKKKKKRGYRVLDDITARFHRGDEYSVAAFEVAQRSKRSNHMKILNTLFEIRPAGMHSEEMEFHLHLRHQTCSSCYTELKKYNWIYEVGTRKTTSGADAGVWAWSPNPRMPPEEESDDG